MHVKKTGVAIIIITFLYFCSYQGGEGRSYLQGVAPVVKHLINSTLLTLVFLFGAIGFAGHYQKWLKVIWISIHLGIISILTILGIADLFIHFTNPSFRDMFGYLRLFFTSPVPFAVLVLLGKWVEKNKKERA